MGSVRTLHYREKEKKKEDTEKTAGEFTSGDNEMLSLKWSL